MATIEGITKEPVVNFVGKDGFFWWVGEVEDNQDPMELGRVKVRVLGYYTNVRGGTTADLPTEKLPWATVLQHTCQPGNDGQGESSGQLQPGAIVMGFFMDGESAQMPVVIGVLRVQKSSETATDKVFAFTGEFMEPGVAPNPSALNPGSPNSVTARTQEQGYARQGDNNSVSLPGARTTTPGGSGSPNNLGIQPGINGSSGNPHKPRQPEKPIPAANGVGGPWKTLEYKLSYLIEDLADTAGTLVKGEDGDFLDVVSGKIVTVEKLMGKIKNFLGAVFSQVVSAVRQYVSNLAESLNIATFIAGATGIPLTMLAVVQTAVQQILASLCNIDSNLAGYIANPIGSLTNLLNGFLDGLFDRAAMIVQGVQGVIDSVICQVQEIINSVKSVIDTVKSAVSAVQQAQDIINAWQTGSKIFEEGADLLKQGITSITGLIKLFLSFIGSGCDRKPKGGEDSVGWFPLFGVTHCTPEELEEINRIRGSGRGSCGNGSSGGSMIDNIINQADPYMSVAKTFINGAYDHYVGTPGRQAKLSRSPNGTMHTSVKLNNYEYGKYVAEKEIRNTENDLTEAEIQDRAEAAGKGAAEGKSEPGNLVADHSSYAGNYTQEVHGDDCKAIDGDHVVNVEGDYFLKITGDCHIEVGGGFFFGAEGAPKTADKNGEDKDTEIQKHTMRFGSDVDVNVVGAKFALQSSEIEFGAQAHKIAGGIYENSCASITMAAGGDLVLSATNTVNIVTTVLNETINMKPPVPPPIKSGIFRQVMGSVETFMIAGGGISDNPPRYTIANPSGAYSNTQGLGCVTTTAAGAITQTAAAGLIALTAGAAISCKAGAAVLIQAELNCTIIGASIFLN
jgi:hypothetical protein